jgi:phage tail sheath protein FI
MPEYLYPGVYVEEVDTGNKPIEGVSTSTAGFLGIAERGPTTATFLTSYTDFQRSFGTYYTYYTDNKGNPVPPSTAGSTEQQAYLAYAVEGFFSNGGLRCYVARAASASAKPASVTSGPVIISAAGAGTSGNNIAFWIKPASINPNDTTLFRLTLYYWTAQADATKATSNFDPNLNILNPAPTQTEDFDNLSVSQASSTYFVGAIGSGSNLVTAEAAPGGAAVSHGKSPVLLTGGTDGVALVLADFTGSADTDPTNPIGLAALGAVDGISILCCPDEGAPLIDPTTSKPAPYGTIAGELQQTCEAMKDRFAILQAAEEAGTPSKVIPTVNSQYAAFYYPWLNVVDPTSNVMTAIPPGGHIAGIYARSDTNENVAKDPANERILGIDSLQLPINNQLQATLNPIGVNCLRYFKGQGNLVWGGRTTATDPDWKYISVRRLFIYIEKSIQQGTQWVVFQPNDPTTWARVRRSVSDFLTGLWMQDMLMGATKEQAFFVRCDNTTMTQADIENGRLIVLVGVAPVYPAEFVIFRIGQWAGGSSVSEG